MTKHIKRDPLLKIIARMFHLKTLGKAVEVDKIIAQTLAKLNQISTKPDLECRLDGAPAEFTHNFSKQFTLKSDILPLVGPIEFYFTPLLVSRRSSLKGVEAIRRLARNMGGFLGQRDAENILLNQDKIPEKLCRCRIIFPGTIWISREFGDSYAPCLEWLERWNLYPGLLNNVGADDYILIARHSIHPAYDSIMRYT